MIIDSSVERRSLHELRGDYWDCLIVASDEP